MRLLTGRGKKKRADIAVDAQWWSDRESDLLTVRTETLEPALSIGSVIGIDLRLQRCRIGGIVRGFRRRN